MKKRILRLKIIYSVIITLYSILTLFLVSSLRARNIQVALLESKTPSVTSLSIEDQRENVLKLINKAREENQLSDLKEDIKLTASAQAKSCDMVAKNYYSHYSPDGKQPWAFFSNAGYNYRYAGENIAMNYYPDESVVNAWLNSPDHRENIMSPNYVDTGVGICGVYIVQHFGAE